MFLVNCLQETIQIIDIRQLPTNATHFHANNINSFTLPNGIFDEANHLVYLDLSINALRIIERNAFTGLHNLVALDLSDNTQLTVGEFLRPLSSLRVLNLRNCGKNDTSAMKHMANGISELKQLEKLKITRHSIRKDDVLLLQNTSVTYLSIARVHGIEQGASQAGML